VDQDKTKNVIILAINPIFARAILSGKKIVEFRRNGVPSNIQKIVIYSTKPDQEILGYCDVKRCIVDSPEKLWQDYGEFGFISHLDYLKYYQGYEIGKCYMLDNPKTFKNPLPLYKCKTLTTAPQSFTYLNKTEWRNFRRRKKANHAFHSDGNSAALHCHR
jgi:predicted transcriptional regulator